MLGRDVNFDGLNKQIEKLRKNINDTYKPDLIDEDKILRVHSREYVTFVRNLSVDVEKSLSSEPVPFTPRVQTAFPDRKVACGYEPLLM